MFRIVSLLWLSTIFGASLAFITQIILARQLGSVEYGSFAAALATVMLIAPLAGFGVGGFWLNIFGKEGWDALQWVFPSLKFSLCSTCSVMTLIIMWAMLGIDNYLLIILSGCVFGQVAMETVSSFYQLEENYFYLSLWQFLQHLLRLTGISVIILTGFPLSSISVAYAYTLASLILLLFGLIPLGRMLRGDILLKGHKVADTDRVFCRSVSHITVMDVFKHAWPFGFAGIFQFVYAQSDIILVKHIVGNKAAGCYNVAFTMILFILLFPTVVYQKILLVKMHRWAYNDRLLFHKIYNKGNVILLATGVIAMIAIWLIAPIVIPVLFGSDYNDSIELMMILSVSVPILFLASNIGTKLVTKGYIKTKVKLMGLVAIINIALNLILIPNYGAHGAAIATIISNIILLFLYYTASKDSYDEKV